MRRGLSTVRSGASIGVVALLAVSGLVLVAPRSAPAIGALRLDVGDAALVEGAVGSVRTVAFPLTLSAPASEAVVVSYRIEAGSASAGSDVDDRGGRMMRSTFAPGRTGTTPVVKQLAVRVVGDDEVEGTETFTVHLLSVTSTSGGVGLGDATGTGTIYDDDAGTGVVASAGDVSLVEGDDGGDRVAGVPITLSRPSTSQIVVSYRIVADTARTPSDFDDLKGRVRTLKFNPVRGFTPVSKLIALRVHPDGLEESDETFHLEITAVSADASIGRAIGFVTIVSDEASTNLTADIAVPSACTSEAIVGLTPDRSRAPLGETVTIGATLEHRVRGACAHGSDLVVGGTVTVGASGGAGAPASLAAWLETPGSESAVRTALPAAAAVTTQGTRAPDACPAADCSGAGTRDLGTVRTDTALDVTITPEGSSTIDFTFVPASLSADELGLLASGTEVTLVVALMDRNGAATVDRAPISFELSSNLDATVHLGLDGPASGDVDVQRTVTDLAPGGLTELAPLEYAFAADDPQRITAHGRAFAGSDPLGPRATVFVSEAPPAPPALAGSAVPDVGDENTDVDVVFAARPLATATGAIELWPAGATHDGAPVVVLVDDGTNGDTDAGDGRYAAAVRISLVASDRVFTITEPTAMGEVTADVTVSVVPADAPTATAAIDGAPTVDVDGSPAFADRVTIGLADGFGYSTVEAAADAVGGTVIGRVSADFWQIGVTAFSDAGELDALLTALRSVDGVASAAPDHVSSGDAIIGDFGPVAPDDPGWTGQWGARAIHADQIWPIENGALSPVKVAVIDSGVSLVNPDIAPQLTSDGLDLTQGVPRPSTGDATGHGTAVAGVIAAPGNNGAGIAGIDWGAQILSIQVCTVAGGGGDRCGDAVVARGIRLAVDLGAQVINISLGFVSPSEAQAEALEYAHLHDVVVVASAGNAACSASHFPSDFDGRVTSVGWARPYDTDVISVGAIGPDGQLSTWRHPTVACRHGDGSNFGPGVDVAAPGTLIPMLQRSSQIDDLKMGNGTSFAAPYVAGLAALLLAMDPADATELGRPLTGAEVRDRIEATAHPIGASGSGLGHGLVDAFDAVFNSSFESGGLNAWVRYGAVYNRDTGPALTPGNARVVATWGTVHPVAGARMAALSTGPNLRQDSFGPLLDMNNLDKFVIADPAIAGPAEGGAFEFEFSVNVVTAEPDGRGETGYMWRWPAVQDPNIPYYFEYPRRFPDWASAGYRFPEASDRQNADESWAGPRTLRGVDAGTQDGVPQWQTGWRRIRLQVPIEPWDECTDIARGTYVPNGPVYECWHTIMAITAATVNHLSFSATDTNGPSDDFATTTLIDDVRFGWVPRRGAGPCSQSTVAFPRLCPL